MGGQGGCERRIEVIVKVQNNREGVRPLGSGRGCQGGWKRRIEVIVKMKKNRGSESGREGGGRLVGVGWGGQGVGWLVARLGVGGDVGYGDVNQ